VPSAAPPAERDRPSRGGRVVAAARHDDVIVAAATLLPLVAFALAERRLAGAPGFPLDDSWIHLHFARNIAEGAGFAYNPGTPAYRSRVPPHRCGRSSSRWGSWWPDRRRRSPRRSASC